MADGFVSEFNKSGRC